MPNFMLGVFLGLWRFCAFVMKPSIGEARRLITVEPHSTTFAVIAGLDPAIHPFAESTVSFSEEDGPADQVRG
jgi:hypothetical protein